MRTAKELSEMTPEKGKEVEYLAACIVARIRDTPNDEAAIQILTNTLQSFAALLRTSSKDAVKIQRQIIDFIMRGPG